jgi:Fur family peroxide stress response transcriptional regulator
MIITRTEGRGRSGAEVEQWCAEFEQSCRSKGIRVTAQRLAVYRVLAESSTHPTAETVYRKLRSKLPALSQATVYRIIEFLEREGLIRRVSATDGIGRFDANLIPHQHLICRVCGAMTDVSIPQLHKAALPVVAGFTVEELDIRLLGSCRKCERSKVKQRGRSKATHATMTS